MRSTWEASSAESGGRTRGRIRLTRCALACLGAAVRCLARTAALSSLLADLRWSEPMAETASASSGDAVRSRAKGQPDLGWPARDLPHWAQVRRLRCGLRGLAADEDLRWELGPEERRTGGMTRCE